MAKQWTRNYDNLFAFVYGVDAGASIMPTFRRIEGDYTQGYLNTGNKEYKQAACHSLSMPCDWTYLTTATNKGSSTSSCDYTYIQLGSGNTPVTYEGYALNSPHISNMSIANETFFYSYDETTQTYTKTSKLLITYKGTEPITVGEFGVFLYFPKSSGTNYYPILVYHETLDEPVTLNGNDTIDIRFTQSIVQPSNIMNPN